MSSGPRFLETRVSDAPPPGSYNTAGSLIKPSFNVLLSEEY
jgi:hypothetical protein